MAHPGRQITKKERVDAIVAGVAVHVDQWKLRCSEKQKVDTAPAPTGVDPGARLSAVDLVLLQKGEVPSLLTVHPFDYPLVEAEIKKVRPFLQTPAVCLPQFTYDVRQLAPLFHPLHCFQIDF